jgi:hypothetical protein
MWGHPQSRYTDFVVTVNGRPPFPRPRRHEYFDSMLVIRSMLRVAISWQAVTQQGLIALRYRCAMPSPGLPLHLWTQ